MSARSCVIAFCRSGSWQRFLSSKYITGLTVIAVIIRVGFSGLEGFDETISITAAICLATISCFTGVYFLYHHMYNFRKLHDKRVSVSNDSHTRTLDHLNDERDFDNIQPEPKPKILRPKLQQVASFRTGNDIQPYMAQRTSFRTPYDIYETPFHREQRQTKRAYSNTCFHTSGPGEERIKQFMHDIQQPTDREDISSLNRTSGPGEQTFFERIKQFIHDIQQPAQMVDISSLIRTSGPRQESFFERIKRFIHDIQRPILRFDTINPNLTSGPREETFFEKIENLINDIRRPRRPPPPPPDLLDN